MINVNKFVGLAAAAAILAATPALAADVKVGILGDITGPIEALAGPIVKAAQQAFSDVNAQGGILDGKLVVVTGDSACDPSVAGPAADKLVNTDQVVGIVGAFCTGATIGAATAAGIPGGVVMISPSATAPALTTLDDKDLVFRTAPSDAFQGVKLADLLIQKGIKSVALTYVNNDYGKGLADVFKATYTKEGGTISADVSHEDGKADYRAELGQLAAGGDKNLVIIAYASGSAHTILQQAVEAGDFTTYIGVDGVIGDDLLKGIDPAAVNGHLFATRAGAYTGDGAAAFDKNEAALKNDKGQYDTYVPQAYDAAFLLALAIEKNGKADRAGLSQALRDVATAPGEKILPGEWKKAVELIKAGKDIDYEGASGPAEFDKAGDVDGIIVEVDVQDGKFVEVGPVK
ncbi:MAG: amino acid ABC transporter substrate-binding protein [Devosia sp. 67-54]|uniref:ABC transporter substrate-binding protein n=1 Tax=unclassified Devosia TaxID=196773 RepID=UPI00095A2408|nr:MULTISPECIES: ABC transporter substrate-binding protein [unclassified Devosia]MBN9305832.1 ABC transporter substrate-binding protein [Devosia sp.]OJX16465.1 MAG: amino acid ABC transporter substrate-binding protein [Devosia sp. 67-54]